MILLDNSTAILLFFPGGAGGKEPSCHCRSPERRGLDPWVRKIPWRRAWQPTPVFLSGELQSIVLQRLKWLSTAQHTIVLSHCCSVAKSYLTLWEPMDCSPPGSFVMGFPRQEYWSGLSFPSPGHLPGSNPHLLRWQADSLPLSHQGSPNINLIQKMIFAFCTQMSFEWVAEWK